MITASASPTVVLAGNPNTGKTTLFNQLTGLHARVGNYPGVTVERHHGRIDLPDLTSAELFDSPGSYSLAARSEEERLALLGIAGLPPLDPPDLVVVVVDASQLTRNLYLALQILELNVPVVVALTMVDMLEAEGLTVDPAELETALGVPVVPIVARCGTGVEDLERAIAKVLHDPSRGLPGWHWRPESATLQADVRAVADAIEPAWHRDDPLRRDALALWALLSLDDDCELADVPDALRAAVAERRRLAAAAGRQIDREIIEGRYGWIDAAAPRFLHQARAGAGAADRIDRVLLHPVFGFALFLVFMTVVFQALFSAADPLIGWIESGVALLSSLARGGLGDGLVGDFVVGGLIGGVGAFVVFLPQILMLFLFIGILEDTGYMARVAVLMDRLMKSVGLHGRAFVPMLSGYACAVPAILATRTMERRRDRMLTMMTVPLMTCSARLPVYTLIIAALVPAGGGLVQGGLMAGMYVFGTVSALAVAAVLGRTLFKGARVPLLIEMPPYRVPHWPSVLRLMWERSSEFLRTAGTIILVCAIGMWALLTFPRETGREAEFAERRAAVVATAEGAAEGDAPEAVDDRLAALAHEEESARIRASFAGRLGRAIEPAIAPLGFDWKIGIGIVGAFAAREVFIATMGVVYGFGEDVDEQTTALRDRMQQDHKPDGSKLFTPLTCLSLMIFFALACQCMSTLAVVARETRTWIWPAFMFAYMGVLAWCASFAVYQGGRLLGFE